MSGTSVLTLGGCLLSRPMRAFAEARYEARHPTGFAGLAKYTLGEMVEFMRVLRGDLIIPLDMRNLTGVDSDFEPSSFTRDLTDIDVVLAEPNSLDKVRYRGLLLLRPAINLHILMPIEKAHPGKNVHLMANAWFLQGLYARDEEIRTSLGPQLAALVPADLPGADLYRDVLLNARGELDDVMNGVRDLKARVTKPMGLITFTAQYMPNGRPMFWPANFREEVVRAAEAFDLPVFEPWKLVRQFGVERTLKPDLRFYREDFELQLGEAIVDFATSIAKRTPPTVARSQPSDQTAASPKRRGLSSGRLAEAVNAELVAVHTERLKSLGPQRSYVQNYRAARVGKGLLIGPQELAIVDLIYEKLGDYDGYAVLRSGLGELALLMAARGLRVSVYEPDFNARPAVAAAKARLESVGLISANSLRIEWGPAPYAALDGRVMAVGRESIPVGKAGVPGLMERMRWFEALLVDPAGFVTRARTDDDRASLGRSLRALGFADHEVFESPSLSWFGKPNNGKPGSASRGAAKRPTKAKLNEVVLV